MKLMRYLSTPRIVLAALFVALLALIPATHIQAQGPWYGSRIYIVQYGDTLYSIAGRTGVPLQTLAQVNGMAPPYSLYVGQQIYLPYGSAYNYGPYGYYRYYNGPLAAPPPFGYMPSTGAVVVPTVLYGNVPPNGPAAAPPLSTTGTTYMVDIGDTLYSIARRFGVSPIDLANLNHLYNPNALYAGTILVIPPPVGNTPPVSQAPPPEPYIVYIVQYGDNLYRIAIRFGTSLYAIVIANNIPNPNLIFAGQRLLIPTNIAYPPPVATPTATPTGTGTPLSAPTLSPTPTLLLSPTPTLFLSPTPTLFTIPTLFLSPTPTLTQTSAPAPSLTPLPTNTPLPTTTPLPSLTPLPTLTPLPSLTPTATRTLTPAPSLTPIGSATISMRNLAYSPNALTVKAGTTVTWSNDETNNVQHTITSGTAGSPSGAFDSGTINPGQKYQFTFTTPGTFTYYCRIHGSSMTGTVVVTP